MFRNQLPQLEKMLFMVLIRFFMLGKLPENLGMHIKLFEVQEMDILFMLIVQNLVLWVI